MWLTNLQEKLWLQGFPSLSAGPQHSPMNSYPPSGAAYHTAGKIVLGKLGRMLTRTSGSLLLSPLELKLCQQPKELNECSRSPEVLGNQQGILIESNLLIRYILNVIITR